ncbi:AEC family transporter [Haladaptatus sp. NG-SE-30]
MAADSLVSVFVSAILPTLSLAVVGYVLGTVRDVGVDQLNTVTIYVFVPALIFHSLVTTPLDGTAVTKLVVGTTVFLLAMLAVAETVGRSLGETGSVLGALVLTSAFPNSGNLGIPLSEFAFGPVGRSTAVLFLTTQTVVIYTVGVSVAARGETVDTLGAIKKIFRLPLIYAVVTAVVVIALGIEPRPEGTVMRTIRMTGNASIPMMLILLGIKLSNTDHGNALSRIGPGATLKLTVAPLLGVGIVLLLGFENETVARVFVLECAAPAAITPLLLTIEFAGTTRSDGISGPEYASTMIFVTTLLSVPVLTLLIVVLRTGMLV